jgi:hypothetical protein
VPLGDPDPVVDRVVVLVQVVDHVPYQAEPGKAMSLPVQEAQAVPSGPKVQYG